MKEYQRLLIDDGRELDVWGKPLGVAYEKKTWEQLSPAEMVADFEWKNDLLESYGEPVSSATFYQDYLFRDLYDGLLPGYKVLLTEYDAEAGSKVHKVDVDEIEDFLDLNDVALSPCLFHSNWRRKKLLNYVCAFVLDIDKLRPRHLQRFFQLFEDGKLLTPSFVINSGSGVHFAYILSRPFKVDSVGNEGNRLAAERIYKCLYDDIIKQEQWKDAQRHWIGQDYRVVNSRTKLNLTSMAFKTGDVYSIEFLLDYYGVDIDREKHYATPQMIRYAGSIAKDLGIEPPDFEDSKATYEFIKMHKDEAYELREQRRQRKAEREAKRNSTEKKKVKKKRGTWYRNTLAYMKDNTRAGNRFSSMKALAYIAYLDKVSRETFIEDLSGLAKYWEKVDWQGDKFNTRNVEAIIRFFDNAEKYSLRAETLEEWLGYEFRRIGCKRNGRSRADHIKIMNAMKALKKTELKEVVRDGRPSAEMVVVEWRRKNPDGKKADCIRQTDLSKPTVYKWWKSIEK